MPPWPVVRPVGNPTGEHHDVILRDFLFDRRRIFRINDQRSPHAAHGDMLVDVDVAVVPHRAGRLGLEAIGESFTRCDCRLRRARNAAVLPSAALEHSMPMNRMRQRRAVLDVDFDIVTFADMDQRTGCLAVEGESVEGLLVDQRDDCVFDRERKMASLGDGRWAEGRLSRRRPRRSS